MRVSLQLQCLVMVLCGISSPLQAVGDDSAVSRPTRVISENELLKTLKQNDLWTKSSHRSDLLRALDTAKLSRSAEVARVLVKHLEFSPYSHRSVESPTILRPFNVQYPVVGSLSAIGLPAVAVIVERIKQLEMLEVKRQSKRQPDRPMTLEELLKLDLSRIRRDDSSSLQHNLLIACMVAIYDVGGDGVSMAMHRLKLETKRSKGLQKQSLLRAIQVLTTAKAKARTK